MVVFALVAFVWGTAATLLVDAARWPAVLAPASTITVVAAFGWTRRGRELLDVLGPAFVVSYAAFAGLAAVRMSAHQHVEIAKFMMDPFYKLWPVAVVGGIIVAATLTIFVAWPASMIRPRRYAGSAANDRYWATIREVSTAHRERGSNSYKSGRLY
jgi:hypothetical protein